MTKHHIAQMKHKPLTPQESVCLVFRKWQDHFSTSPFSSFLTVHEVLPLYQCHNTWCQFTEVQLLQDRVNPPLHSESQAGATSLSQMEILIFYDYEIDKHPSITFYSKQILPFVTGYCNQQITKKIHIYIQNTVDWRRS